MRLAVKYAFGTTMLIVNILCLVLESEVYQGIQEPSSPNYYNKPFFITWFSGLGYGVFLVPFFFERLRYLYFQQHEKIPNRIIKRFFEEEEIKILKFSLIAYIPYFLAGYAWIISLTSTSVTANLIIYNSMFVFVFVFSVILLKERISVVKIISMMICFVGVVITTFSSLNVNDENGITQTLLGYILLILSVIATALYDVFYKLFSLKLLPAQSSTKSLKYHLSDPNLSQPNDDSFFQPQSSVNNDTTIIIDDEKLLYPSSSSSTPTSKITTSSSSLPPPLPPSSSSSTADTERLSSSLLCTGAIGVLSFTTLWPGIIIVNWLGIEPFEVPTMGAIYTMSLAVILDGFQNFSCLAGINFTSPLFISLGSLLSFPFSVAADIIFHSYVIPLFGFVGVIGIIIGFVIYSFSDYHSTSSSLYSSSQSTSVSSSSSSLFSKISRCCCGSISLPTFSFSKIREEHHTP